jgi:hypothetical protein
VRILIRSLLCAHPPLLALQLMAVRPTSSRSVSEWSLACKLTPKPSSCVSLSTSLASLTLPVQRQTNGVSGQTLSELQANKNFRFVPPSLSIKSVAVRSLHTCTRASLTFASQKNILGVARPDAPVDYRPYTRMVIANLPIPAEPLLQTQPGNAALEVLASEGEGVRGGLNERHISLPFLAAEKDKEARRSTLSCVKSRPLLCCL